MMMEGKDENSGPGSCAGLESGGPRKGLGYGRLGKGLKAVGNSGERVWWDRGYHPHVESPRLIQHVTFHLADSLPRHLVEKMAAELKSVPPSLRDTEKEKRIAGYLDAGRGSCVLRVPELAHLVQQTLLHFQDKRYHVFAWCVMPNHVHVLFQAAEGWTMSSIVASWKKYTGRRINAYLRVHTMGAVPPGVSAGLESGSPVWHRDYFDRYIRDDGHFATVVDYIHNNPVKAGLARRAEDWQWSSGFGGEGRQAE